MSAAGQSLLFGSRWAQAPMPALDASQSLVELPGALVSYLIANYHREPQTVITLLNEASRQSPDDPQYLRLLYAVARYEILRQRQLLIERETLLLSWIDNNLAEQLKHIVEDNTAIIAQQWLEAILHGPGISWDNAPQTSVEWIAPLSVLVAQNFGVHAAERMFGDQWSAEWPRQVYRQTLAPVEKRRWLSRNTSAKATEMVVAQPYETAPLQLSLRVTTQALATWLGDGDTGQLRQTLIDWHEHRSARSNLFF
jgi:hypothetical protein